MTCEWCESGEAMYVLARACCVIRFIRTEPELKRRRNYMDWVRRNKPEISEDVERGVVDVLA